jgi:hypothetical protein
MSLSSRIAIATDGYRGGGAGGGAVTYLVGDIASMIDLAIGETTIDMETAVEDFLMEIGEPIVDMEQPFNELELDTDYGD